MRDLIRLRSVVRQIVTRARQHLQGFLLRHGRKHGRGTAWRMAYRRWLSTLAFEYPTQQIAFQDYVDAVMDAERRLKRVEEQIFSLLPEWTLRPVVDALQAMRGIALINAVVLVTEVGDFTRFSNPRQLMAYFGMVPGERSSGETTRRGGITKTGAGGRTMPGSPRVYYELLTLLDRGSPKRSKVMWAERAAARACESPCAAARGSAVALRSRSGTPRAPLAPDRCGASARRHGRRESGRPPRPAAGPGWPRGDRPRRIRARPIP